MDALHWETRCPQKRQINLSATFWSFNDSEHLDHGGHWTFISLRGDEDICVDICVDIDI
jgi:hypothetical protein